MRGDSADQVLSNWRSLLLQEHCYEDVDEHYDALISLADEALKSNLINEQGWCLLVREAARLLVDHADSNFKLGEKMREK